MLQKRQNRGPLLPKINVKKLPFLNLFYTSLVLNTINLVYVVLIQKNLQPEVPLFYGLPEGQDQLTNSLGLAIPAVVSLGVCIVNLLLALISKNKFFQQALLLACFVVSVFSIITVIKITLLIGSF